MLKYILGRVLLIIPTLILVVFVIFIILNITPGDPGRIILGIQASQESVDEINAMLGMDRPLMVRFGNYLLDALRLDFGTSYRSRIPVFDEIMPRFPTTLTLAILAVAASALIGIPLGIISAVRKYSILDYSLTVSSLFIAAVPPFFLALILMLIFALWLGILPSSGIGSIRHFVLPVLTLALPMAAFLARMVRTSMLETMRQDYIRTAKAKGAGKNRVIVRHALKPALMPIITVLGMNFAALLGGALITEIVFGLPGIGNVILTAVRMHDAPIIMGSAVFLAVMFKAIMLIVDIIQVIVDPRLKSRFG